MFTIGTSELPLNVNGGTLYNAGPGTLYYMDRPGVTSSTNDGSLSSGTSAILDGSKYLISASSSSVNVTPSNNSRGIGGSNPFPNGIVISEQVNKIDSHRFSLSPRVSSALGYPVPALRPEGTSTNYNCSLDIFPKGSPSSAGTNGICWIDICDTDLLNDSSGLPCKTVRLAIFSDHVEVGSRGVGGASALPVYIGADSDGTAAYAQIRLTKVTTNPSVWLGADTTTPSCIVLGAITQLATNATKPFIFLQSMNGTPTGVPVNTFGTSVPIIMDSTGFKLWAYMNSTWKSVTFA